jgi:hypothetical protein
VPLVEIDIVNSQPYFLSTILLEVFLSGGQNAPSLPRLLHNSSQDHSSLFSSFHHASNYLQNGEEEEREEEGDKTQPYDSGLRAILNLPVPLDLQMMVQKTSEGKFYETFVQESDKLTRDQVKRKLFQTIFGETKLMRCTPLGKTFERIYPTAFNLMLELKRKKGFLWIGHELQRRESSLVINTVCEALRVDLPEVPVLTVHDSLLVPREHLGHVRALLDNAFQRYVMPPSFKIKEPVQ